MQPTIVLERAKRDGEMSGREVEGRTEVWTERMLSALRKGVKGGRWHSLIDKVYAPRTLELAAAQVIANKGAAGVDHITVDEFKKDLAGNIERLSEALRTGTYRPQKIRRHYIPKPGSKELRPLGIPTVRDRVVQAALRMVVEPIFEQSFADQSYGFRPGRGCKDALRRVYALIRSGYLYIVDADLKSYFDTIPHDRLRSQIEQKVADGRILNLIDSFLLQGVMDGQEEWTPEEGTPQGGVISPLLSNIYLDPLDHRMASLGYEMVRYADDFVILCRTAEEASAALEEVKKWTDGAGLTLHPTKTRVCNVGTEAFEFLGYRFTGTRRYPRAKSLKKLKDVIRGKTRRTRGQSLTVTISDVNRSLKGWFEYFKHSYRTTFPSIDGWIRRRLRSILRKQTKRKGIAASSGADQTRWPNAYFAAQGLYSLQEAHALAAQSRRG